MSSIVNLKHYDLVFTTSFENVHGMSGHLYEMIDYFYICYVNNINCAILLSDGTTKSLLSSAIQRKYNFTVEELAHILNNTFECPIPKIIIVRNLCIADGSSRLNGATVYADNVLLLRCFDSNFEYFASRRTIKNTILLQDSNVYTDQDLPIKTIDYVKKILWSKYMPSNKVKTNTALMYLTTNCRQLSDDQIEEITKKYSYDRYIILTNQPAVYKSSDNVQVIQTPIDNVFDHFDSYIYTSTARQFDCSPRFIVECAVFNKTVHYEIDYVDAGLEARRQAIDSNLSSIELTNNDQFIEIVKAL